MAYEISLDDGKTVAYTAETEKELLELLHIVFDSDKDIEYICVRIADTNVNDIEENNFNEQTKI